MKYIAAAAAFAAVATAQVPEVTIPSQTLNQAQMEALATLSAAQAELNHQNSQMIAADKASQEAAIFSQSAEAFASEAGDLGALESAESESLDSLESDEEESPDSGASSATASVLAIAVVVGAAMF
ncbi:hypothetical protein GGF46_002553 [Coemansia sp. RSA 552]|nr:hypothetical protein GGF46_002553 [Coemansia sp. RSA 552]